MIELPIHDKSGKQVDTLQIDEATLGGEIRFALLKQAYVITHGNQRQGSARTKSRGMVRGSTRKIFRQKGTGNARAGANRTVVRKGGGVAFAKTRAQL
jgi:large subunit ribosomal protein L4